jgi:predicted DCC family thiol-disulfide oxidoreductase YuxK
VTREPPTVLFDGTCNLCNRAVDFILDHERDETLRFASLQSDAGAELLERVVGEDEARALVSGERGDPDTIVVVEGDRAYIRSAAALRIARHLRAPWSWAYALVVIPGALRDLVYGLIARHRYRWFGKSDACRVPTPDLRQRFLG